jgi:tetratricopeptide (TPR) repeat protein
MSTNSPQDFLNRLHEIGISDLYSEKFTNEERLPRIKLARQKLKHVDRLLKRQEQNVKGRWDARDKEEADLERFELAGYELIGDLVSEIEIELSELEIASQSGTEVPGVFRFGDVLDISREGKKYTFRITDKETLKLEEEVRQHQQRQQEMALAKAEEERQKELEALRLSMVNERQRQIDEMQYVQKSTFIQLEQEQNEILKRAVALIGEGEKEQAADLVAQALELDQNDADAWYMAGYLGDTEDEQLEAFERALALQPDHTRARRSLERLKANQRRQRNNRLFFILLAGATVIVVVGLLLLQSGSSPPPLPTAAQVPSVTATATHSKATIDAMFANATATALATFPNAGIQNLPTNTPSKQ